MKSLYVVYSKTQDELTLNNKAFEDYSDSWKYRQELDQMFGPNAFLGPMLMNVVLKTEN